jgi:AcrR family transcriptional regulator
LFLDVALVTAQTAAVTSTARARVRAELTREIKEEARRQLAVAGSAGLSLRAVARELGMVSSAVYRYFPSRDDLLTALIVDAYDAVGAVAEEADAAVIRREDLTGRWMAVARAVRAWAVGNPAEYALIYGSPVPGYRAPETTTGSAERLTSVLLAILADGVRAGSVDVAGSLPAAVRADLRRLRAHSGVEVPDPVLFRGLLAWTHLFGAISFELFGHLHNVIADTESYFDAAMASTAERMGLGGITRRR